MAMKIEKDYGDKNSIIKALKTLYSNYSDVFELIIGADQVFNSSKSWSEKSGLFYNIKMQLPDESAMTSDVSEFISIFRECMDGYVRCLIDEAANIGQIPNLEKLMATIRNREISAVLVLQAKSQLKAIYKDNADTIIGNCDSQIFLGGSEQTTLKDLNASLGKETIDMYNTGETRGTSQSYNLNYQKLGKDLMSVDELAVMDGGKCIVQVRGVRPFLSDKYDLTQHPNYRLTADYDKKNWFDVEKYLNHNLTLKPDDRYQVIEANEGSSPSKQ